MFIMPLMLVTATLAACEDKSPLKVTQKLDIVLEGDFDYSKWSHIKAAFWADDETIVIEGGPASEHRLTCVSGKTGEVLWTWSLNEVKEVGGYEATSQTLMGVSRIEDSFLFLVRRGPRLFSIRWNPTDHKVETTKIYDQFHIERAIYQEYLPIHQGKGLIPCGMYAALFDLKSGRKMQHFSAGSHDASATYLTISDDGKYAAWTCKRANVWEMKTGKRVQKSYMPPLEMIYSWKPKRRYWSSACAISPDNKIFAVGTVYGDLLIFDLKTEKLLGSASMKEPYNSSWVEAGFTKFLPGSRYLVTYKPLAIFDCVEMKWVENKVLRELNDELYPVTLVDLNKRTMLTVGRDNGRLQTFEIQSE